jgi:hypothetical protein
VYNNSRCKNLLNPISERRIVLNGTRPGRPVTSLLYVMSRCQVETWTMRRAFVSCRPLSTPFSRTSLSLVTYRMAGNFVKSRSHVTDLAKVDVIGPTQARDNERHLVEVSRSFVCRCADILIRVNLNLFMTERSGYSDRYAPSQAC